MKLNQLSRDTSLESYPREDVRTTERSQKGFDELGIAPSIMKAINRLNFENPTPIQKDAIPVGIQGDDVIAIAQTGSGKTLAFGIPMLQRLSKSKRGTGLVLVPTRELAIQVEESLRAISRPLNIRSAVLIGGASMSLQRNTLKKNPRIIIATPGRLMDHIKKKTIDLSGIEIFVLDEADRMLDMGFIPDIRRIMKSIPDKRQTMLFSATMPKAIAVIARNLMENPIRIEADRSGATPTKVSHEMFMVKLQDKVRLLAVQLKQSSGPVLVFTRTKWTARKLTTKVNKMGFDTAEIHSNRSQGQRRDALEGFKRGKYRVLIATDIAARGIDVSGIELVINYDMPGCSEDYVHRVGRTGRAGKTGHAVSFATTDQKRSIRDIERFMKTELTISALPFLPSEKLLLREVNRFNNKRTGSKQKDSERKDSNRHSSISQISQLAEFDQKDFRSDGSLRYNLKRNRSAKKKSVGQGSGRKKRPRR